MKTEGKENILMCYIKKKPRGEDASQLSTSKYTVGQNTKGPTWSTILTVLNTGETVCRQNFAIWFLENTTKNVN